MLPDLTEEHDFTSLLTLSREELFRILVETVTYLANLSMRIGFLRADEVRGNTLAKQERVEYESVRVAYEEKKWIIIRLLEL